MSDFSFPCNCRRCRAGTLPQWQLKPETDGHEGYLLFLVASLLLTSFSSMVCIQLPKTSWPPHQKETDSLSLVPLWKIHRMLFVSFGCLALDQLLWPERDKMFWSPSFEAEVSQFWGLQAGHPSQWYQSHRIWPVWPFMLTLQKRLLLIRIIFLFHEIFSFQSPKYNVLRITQWGQSVSYQLISWNEMICPCVSTTLLFTDSLCKVNSIDCPQIQLCSHWGPFRCNN